MVKAAHADALKRAFEHHLDETKAQVERLKEAFGLIGTPPKAKACKGMEGLIEAPPGDCIPAARPDWVHREAA